MAGFFSFFLARVLIPAGSSFAITSLGDLVPFALAAAFLMAAWGLSRHRPSGVARLARDRLFEGLSDAALVLDAQDLVIDLNSVAQRILGSATADVLGQPFAQVCSAWPELIELVSDGKTPRQEIALEREEGPLYLEVSLMNLDDGRGHLAGRLLVLRDATEQKQAAELLCERERRLEQAVEVLEAVTKGTEVIVSAQDTDFRYIFFNKAYREEIQRLAGKDIEIGSSMIETFAHMPEQQALAVDQWSRALHGETAEQQVEFGDPSRWRRVYRVRRTPLWDAQRNVIGAGEVAFDVTAQVQAEQARRESEERLERAQEIAHLGSWELDVANNRLTWSDEVYRIFGFRPQEFGATYEAFLECVHPDDRAAVDAAYSGSLREDRDAYEIEHRVVRRDNGEVRFVHEKCEHVRDVTGEVIRSIGMVHDITERKRDEEQITSLARFPAENPNPTLRVSLDGTILYSNDSGRVFLETWNTEVGDTAPPDWQQTIREALRTKSEKVQDLRCGESTYLVAAMPIWEGGYVNLYGRDVTKEREGQEALQQAHDELEVRVNERTEQLLRTNEQLRAEIKERIRTEELLRLEEARLDALLRLSRITDASVSEVAGFVLEQGIALTQSKIGFVGFLDEDESIYTLNAVSKEVVKECDVSGDPVQWHIAGAGIWADAIRERRTLFINDYSQPHPRKKELPPGHPYVEKFMVVPLLEGERVVAVAGVGNKASDYDSADERQIALLLGGMYHSVERARAREALQEVHDELKASEERFRQLAENIHEVFWLLEADTWRVLYVSPAYDAIWGRPRQELAEQPLSFLDTVHPADREQVLEDLTSHWQAYDGEFRIVHADGTPRWIRLRSFPVCNDKGEVYRLAGVAVDRTAQKTAEAALVQAERLAITGKLAASLAHEINNPLQAVIGCLGLLEEALEDDRDPSTYLKVARQEVKRTAHIVSQLRSLGRPIPDGDKEPTDLNNLLNDVVVLNEKHLQDHKIEVIWEPDADLPSLPLMPEPMRQVFLNLVINAADAMPGGGQLRLSTEHIESRAGVRVMVADSGTGIPPEVLPHIFEAFYSTKPDGLGVGLFTSQTIVQQHGGWIEVESEPGAGTTFTVWLPS
jgi:PAS domain S-box-containing protein